MLCDDLEGWEGLGLDRGPRGREYIYIRIADSCCYVAEANTTL